LFTFPSQSQARIPNYYYIFWKLKWIGFKNILMPHSLLEKKNISLLLGQLSIFNYIIGSTRAKNLYGSTYKAYWKLEKMVDFVGKMRNCFNIEFVHYACLCMHCQYQPVMDGCKQTSYDWDKQTIYIYRWRQEFCRNVECTNATLQTQYHYRRIIHDTSWMQLMLIGIQIIAISASSCPNYRANQYFI
jgi:hypothetical protein